VTATDSGDVPTVTVAPTVFVAVLITETVLSRAFATYRCEPSGEIAESNGKLPIGMVATTVLLGIDTTVTAPGPEAWQDPAK